MSLFSRHLPVPALSGRRRLRSSLGAVVLAVASIPSSALAQSAAPAVLEDIVVLAPRRTTAVGLRAAPGGTAILSEHGMPATANLTMSRVLADAPGVVVQDFFGGNDQPRIQIRGSGLQQNPVERGVLVLRNGLPMNRADGSYIVGFANPSEAREIEVYRGYMANRLGATVLGGALNLVSATGRSAPGTRLDASIGSFGQSSGGAQAGFASTGLDGLLRADFTRRDGYRDYNASERTSVGGNLGIRLLEAGTLRLFAGYADLAFDVSGPLPRALLESDPRAVFSGPTVGPGGAVSPGPNVVRDRPRRDATQVHAGARVTGAFDGHVLDFALGYARTEDRFRFPISGGVRATEGGDVTMMSRYAWAPDATEPLPLFEATAQYVAGVADRDHFLNLSGQTGALFGRNRLDADTLSLNVGFNLALSPGLVFSPSLAWSRASRGNEDRYPLSARPTAAFNPARPEVALPGGFVPAYDTSYARTWDGWSPAVGLSWRRWDRQILFVAASRTFEPPTHDDLFATVNGTPNSSPGRPAPGNPALQVAAFAIPALRAQRATTVEAGWRGDAGSLSWDVIVYHASIRDELLSLRDESGVALGAVNAPRTRHLGLELGVSIQLSGNLTGRLVYTAQDFRFRDDPAREGKRLAGAPPHWINAALTWWADDRLNAQAALRWSPSKTPVDNLNTLYNGPYATIDLRSEYRLHEGVSVFAEVTNLFDRTHASSTLVVDQARPDQAAFLPGDGRAFGGGLTVKF